MKTCSMRDGGKNSCQLKLIVCPEVLSASQFSAAISVDNDVIGMSRDI